MVQVQIDQAVLSDGSLLCSDDPSGALPLYKTAIASPGRFGAFYLTARELRALRDHLCMIVPDDAPEAA